MRKLKNGRYSVTISIEPKAADFVLRRFAEYQFNSPEHYVLGLFNSGFTHAFVAAGEGDQRPLSEILDEKDLI